MFFFSKPPVFKVNIHNLSQFVNHTVTLVNNTGMLAEVSSVFLKFFFFFYFLEKIKHWKKKRSKCFFFFFKPPVFKVNIHNLSQFVNHTVILVNNTGMLGEVSSVFMKKNMFS